MTLLRSTPLPLALALALALSLVPGRARAQDPDGFRIGVSLLGTSMVSVVVEHMQGRRGLEVAVGTWTFRDLSVSGAVKAYFGPSAMRPFVGAGMWALLAAPKGEDLGGAALVARVPVGFDWRAAPGHFVGGDVNLSRALWLWRTDESAMPLTGRILPIPGLSYRHMR